MLFCLWILVWMGLLDCGAVEKLCSSKPIFADALYLLSSLARLLKHIRRHK